MFHSPHCNHSYLIKANYSLSFLCNHDYMETIGQRIKRIRESANVSQQYIADKVGVSRVAVTKWENGHTSNLKLDNLMKLCKLLDISVEYLIYGEAKKDSSKELKFLSKKDLDINEIASDLRSPDIHADDVAMTKSVVKRLKNSKAEKKTQTKKDKKK